MKIQNLTLYEAMDKQGEILADYLEKRTEQQIDDVYDDNGCWSNGHSFPIFARRSKYRFICDYCKAKLPNSIVKRIIAVEYDIRVVLA